MNLRVYKISNVENPLQNAEGEVSQIDREVIEVKEIQTSLVKPFSSMAGTSVTMEELANLLSKIEPLYTSDKADDYYAEPSHCVVDWDKEGPLRIPHYIGFRLVTESILKKYVGQTDLKVEIG